MEMFLVFLGFIAFFEFTKLATNTVSIAPANALSLLLAATVGIVLICYQVLFIIPLFFFVYVAVHRGVAREIPVISTFFRAGYVTIGAISLMVTMNVFHHITSTAPMAIALSVALFVITIASANYIADTFGN